MLEFVKYVLSRDGQTDTVNSGFYPITEAIRAKALNDARHLKRFELKGIGSRSGARTSAVLRRSTFHAKFGRGRTKAYRS